jgi:ribosomal protein L37AE/L43A
MRSSITYPEAWRGCGRRSSEQDRPGGRFGRRQVAELPSSAVIYFEHRTHELCCPDCGSPTTASLPDRVAASPFGARSAGGGADADSQKPHLAP